MTEHRTMTIVESNQDNNNKLDHEKYITCTQVDQDWGKDFSGTTESVTLCTPPWNLLREALYGIVQNMRNDESTNETEHDYTVQQQEQQAATKPTQYIQPPVDIAYVVVVNAAARLKKTKPAPPTSSSLRQKQWCCPSNTKVEVSKANEMRYEQTLDSNAAVASKPKPRYKLVVDDGEGNGDNEVGSHTNTNSAHQTTATITELLLSSKEETKNEESDVPLRNFKFRNDDGNETQQPQQKPLITHPPPSVLVPTILPPPKARYHLSFD
jgi:hypothetical protein